MKKDTAKKVAVVGVVLIGAYLLWRRQQANAVTNGTSGVPAANGGGSITIDPFELPYFYPTPGIQPNPIILNGRDSAFVSEYDISVSSDNLSYLTNKYMPLFGFVGVSGIGIQ